MKVDSKLADGIESGAYLLTAEYLPRAGVDSSVVRAAVDALDGKLAAVNAADNPFGVGMSSLAAALAMADAGVEPVYQIATRDR